MNKRKLLTTASIIIFSAATKALVPQADIWQMDFEEQAAASKNYTPAIEEAKSPLPLLEQQLPESPPSSLPASVVVGFTELAYAVNDEGWDKYDTTIKVTGDGWKLVPFNGTTGSAYNQVESPIGLLAFKGDHVVIANRGTETWDDLLTDVRFSRSPFGRIFSNEANKISAITAQFFFGVEGEIANGFLQTHLSSWDAIQKAIMDYAASVGKKPNELHYTVTGHSMGAAVAQINALRLLKDPELGIGVINLEESFIDDSVTEDLGESGFLVMGRKSELENPKNVEVIVFESPRVFSNTTAKQVDKILLENLLRVENGNSACADPVIFLPPAFLGFGNAGKSVPIDSGWLMVRKHYMRNVGPAAIPAIDAYRGIPPVA